MAISNKYCVLYHIDDTFIQIAADYAKQDYEDFAVVIQPFVSNAKCDKFPIEFLSDVSKSINMCGKCTNSIHTNKHNLCTHSPTHNTIKSVILSLYAYLLPAGLLSSFADCTSKHGQSTVEQHDHSSSTKERLF